MNTKTTPGKFIALEGGEGSGKSSMSRIVADIIAEQGFPVINTREPGGTVAAERLRDLVVQNDLQLEPSANALIFAAARQDHTSKLIRPTLSAGTWVVSDRYLLSTLAYQCAGEGVDTDMVFENHRATTGYLLPDLTIIFDVDPQVGLERSLKRLANAQSTEDRFENYDLAFHNRVQEANLAYNLSPKVIIDANQSLEDVEEQLRECLSDFLAENLESVSENED